MPIGTEPGSFLRSGIALVVVLVAIIVLVVLFPAYRWFLLISIGIGVIVAVILYFWNRWRPLKEEDIDNNKRPLGL